MDQVVTIADVEPNVTTHDGRKSMILHLAEYPQHNYWLSARGVKILADQFGTKVSGWLDRKFPLVVVETENPSTGEPVDSLQVAAQVDWDVYMTVTKTAKMEAAEKKKTARKSARKSTRTRR